MFGSTTLEVAIGLALLFFILATAASAVVEAVNKVLARRAKDLEQAVLRMVVTDPGSPGAGSSRIAELLNLGQSKVHARYVSAKAFADAAAQLIDEVKGTPAAAAVAPLIARAEALARQAKGDATALKAGLETWFDDTMSDVQSEFQRRATLWLGAIGMFLVVATNSSAIHVAQDLWSDTTARQTVVAAAEGTVKTRAGSTCAPADPVCEASRAYSTDLPIGWDPDRLFDGFGDFVFHVLGWLVTGALILLGAPFWFDVLNRLIGARNGRVKPASEDPGSHTTLLRSAPAQVVPSLEYLGINAMAPGVDRTDREQQVDWLDVALNRAPA